MTEIWKDVVNYQNEYQISNYGRVKSIKRRDKEKILTTRKDKCGYEVARIFKYGEKVKYLLVHQLVVDAFIRVYDRSCEEVHHKNRIRDDNRLENLQILPSHKHHTLKKRSKQIWTIINKMKLIIERESVVEMKCKKPIITNKYT